MRKYKYTNDTESGFTLVELLVTVAIISILSTIAVSQYSVYKESSYNITAKSDLRNAITSEEAAYVDTGAYVSCLTALACEANLPEFSASKQSDGTTSMLTFELLVDATGQNFTATAKHLRGSIQYDYDSTNGVFMES